MEESHSLALRFLASQLVFIAALIHVGRGAVEWLNFAMAGFLLPLDVRWPLFVASGLAVMTGLWLAYRADSKRPWYLLGVIAMLGYVFAYFGWHLGGHRRWLFFGDARPHELTFQFVVDHFFAGTFETITLTVELAAAALLAMLYVADVD